MTQSSPISDTISSPEPSEILQADSYLIESWRLGYLSLKEAERRALVSVWTAHRRLVSHG